MSAIRRFRSFVLVILIAAAPAWAIDDRGAGRHSKHAELFQESEYLANVGHLASDELEGRGTGQAGIDKAAEFIASHFERMGVQPAGEDGTYFDYFTLPIGNKIAEGNRLAIGVHGRRTRRSATLHEDFAPLPFTATGAVSGGVVFAGYGIVNEDRGYDEYEGVDVEGRVVLVLRGVPGFAEFDPWDKTFRRKADRARDHNAAALLLVNPVEEGKPDEFYDFESNARTRAYGLPMLQISQNAANRMLEAAGLPDLAVLQKRIDESKAPASALLEGVSVRGYSAVKPAESPCRNVVGKVPGTGPQADEIIVVGAHYDHLGIRNKGSAEFDPTRDISNGADDNASGTTAVMQLARAYGQGAKPNRTVVFMLFSGEEMGLLGSQHFASNPTIDLEKVVAMLNLDMVGRLKNDVLTVGGMGTGSGFEDMVRRLAKTHNISVRNGGGGAGPSDHTSFYMKNIPVLFFFTGLHAEYHQPTDDTPLLNIEGAIRVAKLTADCIDEIDARAERPAFSQDRARTVLSRAGDPEPERRVAARETPKPDAAAAQPSEPADASGRVQLGVFMEAGDDAAPVVAGVRPESPAARAGIQPGDRIVRVGEHEVSTRDGLAQAIGGFKTGQRTTIQVRRGDEIVALAVAFGAERGEVRVAAADAAAPSERAVAAAETRAAAANIDRSLPVVKSMIYSLTALNADAQATSTVEQTDGSMTYTIRFADGESPYPGHAVGIVEEMMTKFDEFARKGMCKWSVSTNVQLAGDQSTSEIVIRAERSSAAAGVASAVARPALRIVAAEPNGNERSPADDVVVRDARDADDAHGGAGRARGGDGGTGGEDAAPPMPKVRLGIMPSYGESEGEGFEISGVVKDGPAEKAGMKSSDRIVAIDGRKIADIYDYMTSLQGKKPGDKLVIEVLRDGNRVKLTITCGAPAVKEAA